MNTAIVLAAALAAALGETELERRVDLLCDSFGISSERSLIGPNDLGMANGHITVNGYYPETDEVRGLYAPPYHSGDFRLCVSVNGKGVSAQSYFWRPERLTRIGTNGDWKVTSDLVLADGRRGGMVRYVVKNVSRSKKDLELKWWHLGTANYQKDWGFTKPTASDSNRKGVFALASSLGSENEAVPFKGVPSGGCVSFAVAFALGAPGENDALVLDLVANPEVAMAKVKSGWRTRVRALAEKMPWFDSDDRQLNRLYRRSLLHLLVNEWDVPEFKLHPYYATGGVNGGCICNYLWNYGGPYRIWPLLNPEAAKAHLDTFLGIDLEKWFFFYPMDGRGGGLYYMINQEKIVFLIDALAREHGGADFLNQRFGDLTYAEWAQKMALTHDDLTKDAVLHDYGESNAHLELRTGANLYNGVMPDLNLRRVRLLRMADRLMKWAGQTPKADLAKRADALRDLCRKELWDEDAGWFRARCADGSTPLRWTMQMFKAFGGGALDADVEAKMLAHLMNPGEFLGDYGIHSLAKTDPAYDVNDVDNGGPGACPSFAPAICDRLYDDGHVEEANAIFMRLKWLADALPYWGDSQYADRMDYRRDTPLQSDIEGATIAQTMIFGLFGISIADDGTVTSSPHVPQGVKWMTLDNLRIRGKTYAFKSSENAPMVGCHLSDSFEGFAPGADVAEIDGWSGTSGSVEARDYAPPTPPGYVMTQETHSQVADVSEGTVSRLIPQSLPSDNRIDFMVCCTRGARHSLPAASADALIGIACDFEGRLCVWHLYEENGNWQRGWTRLADRSYAEDDWVRIAIEMDYASNPDGDAFAKVVVNGSCQPTPRGVRLPTDTRPYGPWYYLARNRRTDGVSKPSAIFFSRTKVDDLMICSRSVAAEHTGATSVDGISFTWFDSVGMPRDPSAPAPFLAGYTLGDAHDAGIDPCSRDPFRITDFAVDCDGRLVLRFNGFKGETPTADQFGIFRAERADFSDAVELPSSEGVFSADAKRQETVWRSCCATGETAFYRVRGKR